MNCIGFVIWVWINVCILKCLNIVMSIIYEIFGSYVYKYWFYLGIGCLKI